ncbi:MAG TPA: hypothetical protein PKN96_12375, partial [Flavobacterium sp.]|nr:hypothetical protein [Flavobacterium sp.]
ENGFLVPVGDTNLFAEKLQLLIDNPTVLNELSSNASKIKQTNDLKTVVSEYESFLFAKE